MPTLKFVNEIDLAKFSLSKYPHFEHVLNQFCHFTLFLFVKNYKFSMSIFWYLSIIHALWRGQVSHFLHNSICSNLKFLQHIILYVHIISLKI